MISTQWLNGDLHNAIDDIGCGALPSPGARIPAKILVRLAAKAIVGIYPLWSAEAHPVEGGVGISLRTVTPIGFIEHRALASDILWRRCLMAAIAMKLTKAGIEQSMEAARSAEMCADLTLALRESSFGVDDTEVATIVAWKKAANAAYDIAKAKLAKVEMEAEGE